MKEDTPPELSSCNGLYLDIWVFPTTTMYRFSDTFVPEIVGLVHSPAYIQCVSVDRDSTLAAVVYIGHAV